MTFKLALLVLALLLLVGAIGKARLPRAGKAKPPAVEAARKCEACGAWVLADATCTRPDCPRA